MTILITGANRGLGYATARRLAAEQPAPIVLAGRDREGLEQAAQRIQAESGHSQLLPMHLDLAELSAVRAFAAQLRDRDLPPLSLLIANAGISRRDVAARSADGIELTFAVNHLGHFLLVHLLLAQMAPPARIIVVSSSRHDPAQAAGPMPPPRYERADWLAHPERAPDPVPDDRMAGEVAYATSKLCNVLFAFELARRLDASALSTPSRPITVNAFDPGLIAGTGLGRSARGMTRLMWYHVMPLMTRLFGFGRTLERSASDLAFLATAPELAGVTGTYFSGRAQVESSTDSRDRAKAADLWETSLRLVALQPDESPLPLAAQP